MWQTGCPPLHRITIVKLLTQHIRRLLGTHQLQSAFLVVGLPVTQDWFKMGCHLSPSLISIRLTAWTWIVVHAVPPSRGRGGVTTNTDLQSRRTNCQPLVLKKTNWISTRKVYRRSGRFAYAKQWGFFWVIKEGRCHVRRSDSCLWHCLASWSHLQAAETSAGEANFPNDHATCSYQSFILTKGDSKPNRLRRLKKWRPTGISFIFPSFQHVHIRSAFHNLQKVCLHWRLGDTLLI